MEERPDFSTVISRAIILPHGAPAELLLAVRALQEFPTRGTVQARKDLLEAAYINLEIARDELINQKDLALETLDYFLALEVNFKNAAGIPLEEPICLLETEDALQRYNAVDDSEAEKKLNALGGLCSGALRIHHGIQANSPLLIVAPLSEAVSTRWQKIQDEVRRVLAQYPEPPKGEGRLHEEILRAFNGAKEVFEQKDNAPRALVVAELLMNDKFANATDEREGYLVEASLAIETARREVARQAPELRDRLAKVEANFKEATARRKDGRS